MRPLLLLLVFALSAGPLLSADEPQVDPFNAPKIHRPDCHRFRRGRRHFREQARERLPQFR